ncbi:MAG: hydantoinase/oxoprolinase family protein [Myxococcales bacterium]|nr:hydantoinase/oxoprolinase family protein [Myxococcales bacterium]
MKVAVDVGGTFTDVLAIDERGRYSRAKLRTDPRDLSACFLSAVKTVLSQHPSVGVKPAELLYGTTHALNALLTHDFPPVGLIVNKGFRELLETARLPVRGGGPAVGERPAPSRLVPLEQVRELSARLDADGTVRVPVDEGEVLELARRYRSSGIRSVAVSLLHSYADPIHERQVAEIFRREAAELDVILSSDVLPALREYERTLATCLNACLIALTEKHIRKISDDAPSDHFYLMKSSGGLGSARSVARRPLSTSLSGPAAAVVGAAWLGHQVGIDDLITLDIGGTSTDVALIREGEYALTTAGEVAGFPWKSPMVDLFTLGAGGGSIAHEAPDHRWHVGPESAGADPGPICYGSGGDRVTLTDAHLVLGRLPEALLGGELTLRSDLARDALAEFGAARSLDAEGAARGILEIATHQMCGAVRRVSVLRGHDPKHYALFGIGGAGPLHAAELAALLSMRTVVIPPNPGLAAPHGLMVADIREDFVRALGRVEEAVDVGAVLRGFRSLEKQGRQFLVEEGATSGSVRLQRAIDMRYAGMLHETTVPLSAHEITPTEISDAVDSFHREFERTSGHSHRGVESVELVNLRVTATAERSKAPLPRHTGAESKAPRPREVRRVGFLHQRNLLKSAVFDRDSLPPGAAVSGPAVIEQAESTTIVPPEFEAIVDSIGNLIIRPTAEQEHGWAGVSR